MFLFLEGNPVCGPERVKVRSHALGFQFMGYHAHPCSISIQHSFENVKYFFQISRKQKSSKYAQTNVLSCEIRVHSDFSVNCVFVRIFRNICLIYWHFCADTPFPASQKNFFKKRRILPLFSFPDDASNGSGNPAALRRSPPESRRA
ncbi:MAG: hypothetical protein K6E36_02385 [Oscillospiraceae bacterium]|nr:hypothetical protein [Oscillospiraceae bacterium]